MQQETQTERLDRLRAKARRLPLTPGVYLMHDRTGKIIYIGKAKALKNRVTQYFGSDTGHTDERQRPMFAHTVEYGECHNSEGESEHDIMRAVRSVEQIPRQFTDCTCKQ